MQHLAVLQSYLKEKDLNLRKILNSSPFFYLCNQFCPSLSFLFNMKPMSVFIGLYAHMIQRKLDSLQVAQRNHILNMKKSIFFQDFRAKNAEIRPFLCAYTVDMSIVVTLCTQAEISTRCQQQKRLGTKKLNVVLIVGRSGFERLGAEFIRLLITKIFR